MPPAKLRISPLGLVPKKEPGEFPLLHHLSYPSGKSLNDFIDPKLCSVQYTSFDEAVHMVQDLGRSCLLGKSDIKSAFRLLPVSVLDFDQLGFKFDGKFYFDKAKGTGNCTANAGNCTPHFSNFVSPSSPRLVNCFTTWMIFSLGTRREPTIAPVLCQCFRVK